MYTYMATSRCMLMCIVDRSTTVGAVSLKGFSVPTV